MENLLFSINAIVPVFIVILIGFLLKKYNIMDDNFVSKSTSIVFKIALPALLFNDISKSNLRELFDPKIIIIAICGTFIFTLLLFVGAALFLHDNKIKGAFIQGCFRGNFAILGIPIIKNISGEEGAAVAATVLAFIIPLYNMLAVIVLSYFRSSGRKNMIKKTLLEILKNPLIIASIIGIIFSLTGFSLPSIISKPVDYMAQMSTPLALLGLGGSIKLSSYVKKMKLSLVACIIKLIVSPLIILAICFLSGIKGIPVAVFIVLFGAPTAVSSYIMARQMDSDHELASQIIILTTTFSVFTMFLWIFLLKNLGYI